MHGAPLESPSSQWSSCDVIVCAHAVRIDTTDTILSQPVLLSHICTSSATVNTVSWLHFDPKSASPPIENERLQAASTVVKIPNPILDPKTSASKEKEWETLIAKRKIMRVVLARCEYLAFIDFFNLLSRNICHAYMSQALKISHLRVYYIFRHFK